MTLTGDEVRERFSTAANPTEWQWVSQNILAELADKVAALEQRHESEKCTTQFRPPGLGAGLNQEQR